MCNVDYQHPSNVLFIELHVLKLHDLIELRTAMIMHKAKTGCIPVNLQTMFHMSLERIHDTRYSTNFIFYAYLKFPCTKTDVLCTLYSVSSSLMYNSCIQL